MNDAQRLATVDRRPAPAHNNRPKLFAVAVATGTVLVVMSTFFWAMAHTEPVDQITALPAEVTQSPEPVAEPTPPPTPEPAPTPVTVEVPPAPASNKLTSNDWVLSPYAILRQDGNLLVTGTLQNRAAEARSASVNVFVYVDGQPVATGSGTVQNVPADSSIEVELPSGTPWTAGNKVLLLQADDLP